VAFIVLFVALIFYPSILPGLEPPVLLKEKARHQHALSQGHSQAARSKAHRDAPLERVEGNFEL